MLTSLDKPDETETKDRTVQMIDEGAVDGRWRWWTLDNSMWSGGVVGLSSSPILGKRGRCLKMRQISAFFFGA
jgi:hypothetical protein